MADQHESPRRTTSPSHDDVARRAYELFETRGGELGHDLEDWLDAERQLSQTFPSDSQGQGRSRRREGER
jgi:hypothetical protein